MNVFTIESESRPRIANSGGYHDNVYRFASCYNGMRGPWRNTNEKAVEDGENHAAVLRSIGAGSAPK